MLPALIVLAPLLPLFALAAVVGLRRPMWLLAIYAAIVPWGSGFSLPLGLPASLSSLSTLAGAAASVGIVAHLLATRRRTQVVLPSLGLLVLFLAWTTLTVLWSVDVGRSLDQLLALVSLVGLFVVTTLVATDDTGIETFEVGIVAGGVLAGAVAGVQLLTRSLPLDGAGTPRFELAGGGGESGDPNITAAILVLPFAVAMAHALRSGTRPPARALWLLSTGLVSLGIALTASRGGLLGAAVAAAVLAWAFRVRLRTLLALASVLAAIGVALLLGPGTLEQRFTESSGTTGRSDVWRIGLVACEQHCLTGAGWGTFGPIHEEILLREPFATGRRFQFEPHNAWLGTAVEAGLPGLGLLVGGIVALGWSLGRVPRERRAAALAGLVGVVTTNTFLSNQDFKYFWLVLTYAAVVAASSGIRASGGPPLVVSRPRVREDVPHSRSPAPDAMTLERIP